MDNNTIDKNAQALYFNAPNSYWAEGIVLLKLNLLPSLSRKIYFWIVDLFKGGAETKKFMI
ncbi:MAG: hypothetical protein HWD61_12695 [Parachlamydiaceae bacterium]|nr:MAG: hypothetical protein HWD61_12695 [Parachlamydiaceae bacterium]